METIFGGEISLRRNFGRNPKKWAISTIFPDISDGQHRSTVGQMRYSASKCPFAIKGTRTPNQKVWGSAHLPLGKLAPF